MYFILYDYENFHCVLILIRDFCYAFHIIAYIYTHTLTEAVALLKTSLLSIICIQ